MKTKRILLTIILVISGLGIVLISFSGSWPSVARLAAGSAGFGILFLLAFKLYRDSKKGRYHFTQLQRRFLIADLVMAIVGALLMPLLGIWSPIEYENLGDLGYGLIFLLSIDLWGDKVVSE